MNLAYPKNRQVDHNSAIFKEMECAKINTDISWIISDKIHNYQESFDEMYRIKDEISHNRLKETVWLLEIDHVYSMGKMSQKSEILPHDDTIPFINTNRGGKITYHGPGQRICYMMLDIKKRNIDIRTYIWTLEELIIKVLKNFSLDCIRKDGMRGIFVEMPISKSLKKIASIGVNVSKGITTHGFALNNNPDLKYFKRIIPCGIKEYGVTSLEDLGINVNMDSIDRAIQTAFYSVFF